MKGIILAGGSGTRLYPSTNIISKQLLPVYDKPMIYYPLSILMLAGITDVLIISTPKDIGLYEELFGDGSELGISVKYAIQEKPLGLAQAFLIGEDFIGEDNVCLILGDNIFYGSDLIKKLNDAKTLDCCDAKVFAYRVHDPERYGVIEFTGKNKVVDIEEKPENPKSSYAVTGLYMYKNNVIEVAKKVKPSPRGELEITDVNKEYVKNGTLGFELLGRGVAWLDTGTHESLLEASQFIATVEKRQGLKISCIEEIAYRQGYITKDQLIKIGQRMHKNAYGKYLLDLAENE